jgi:hypothetical protein
VLHDTFVRVDESRKQCKDVIVDQKKTIKTLKKKLIYYKDRLKHYCANSTHIEDHRALSPESHHKRLVAKPNDNKVDKHKLKHITTTATAREDESRRSQRRAPTMGIDTQAYEIKR